MESVEIDLGGLELSSKESNLRLQLSSRARFAASAKDDIDALNERLTSQDLNTTNVNRPWITCGHAFQLELSLLWESDLILEGHEAFVEHISEEIRASKVNPCVPINSDILWLMQQKLWKGLGLQAASVETFSSSNQHHTIRVDLATRPVHNSLANSKLHKLAIPPPRDTRPPNGTRTVSLERVHLDLRVQRGEAQQPRKLKRLRKRSGPKGERRNYGGSFTGISKSETDLSCTKMFNGQSDIEITSSTRQQDLERLFESDDMDVTEANGQMLFGTEAADMIRTEPLPLEVAPSLLKRSSSASRLDADNTAQSQGETLDLLDAAIRMAISDCRRSLPGTVSLKSTESLRHLEELAPSIWRQDYLQDVAGGAILLPTICHAVDSICCQKTTGQGIKRKVERLITEAPTTRNASQHRQNAVPPTAGISTCLWGALQRSTYNRPATKKIRALFSTKDKSGTKTNFQADVIGPVDEDLCESIPDDSDGIDHDDLFVNDDDFDCSNDEDYGDLFEDDHTVLFDLVSPVSSSSGAVVAAEGIDSEYMAGVVTADGMDLVNDDVFSICGSLSSLPISEDCFEGVERTELALEDANPIEVYIERLLQPWSV